MASQPRAARTGFLLNATLSVSLLVLLAAVALVVKAPAPPGIAEFAPQAAHPITKAPLNQSGTNGSGSGACAAGATCESPRPSPKPRATNPVSEVIHGVPSALQCYTWPDGSVTQTFDPQSPPCVASWPDAPKGNGGATSQGVTANEIRVAVPQASSANTNIDQLKLIAQFFNTRFQLYGRKITLVPFRSQQIASSDGLVDYRDPSAQHADAVQAASLKTFAAVDFMDGHYAQYTATLPSYVDALAQHKVIALMGGSAPAATNNLAAHAPYQWSYLPTTGSIADGVAGLVCRQLKGHPASHSSEFRTKQRTFAIVLPAGDNKFAAGTVPGVQKMIDTMAACGVAKPHVIYYQPNDSSITASMVQLRSEGVTSLIFYPAGDEGAGTPQLAAQKASYYPEWVTFGPGPYVMANLLAGAKRETAQTFGVASWSKILSPAQQPWSQAFTSVGGVEGGGHLLAGGKGFYEELQLLASGIQMAGPKLTTETWSAALTAIAFPNPGAGTTPSYQAHVGFANGKHEMISDFAGWWFDPSATNVEQIQATAVHDYDYSNGFCYVDLGSRWNADSWAPEDRFLHGGCR